MRMALNSNYDPRLSELTTVVIAHPTAGQPIIKVMTMMISDVPSMIEEAAASTVPYTDEIKLSQTAELGIMCAPKSNRLRLFKVRVLGSEVQKLAEHLFEKYEAKP